MAAHERRVTYGVAPTIPLKHDLIKANVNSKAEKIFYGMELVLPLVTDPSNAGVNENLEAVNTGSVSDIDIRVADTHPILGCMGNGINLCVDGAVAVLFRFTAGCFGLIDQTTNIDTVG